MAVKSASISAGNQVYLPKEILDEAHVPPGGRFLVRVRHGIIELVPESMAQEALDAGLENLRAASLAHVSSLWDNEEDEAWNEV